MFYTLTIKRRLYLLNFILFKSLNLKFTDLLIWRLSVEIERYGWKPLMINEWNLVYYSSILIFTSWTYGWKNMSMDFTTLCYIFLHKVKSLSRCNSVYGLLWKLKIQLLYNVGPLIFFQVIDFMLIPKSIGKSLILFSYYLIMIHSWIQNWKNEESSFTRFAKGRRSSTDKYTSRLNRVRLTYLHLQSS